MRNLIGRDIYIYIIVVCIICGFYAMVATERVETSSDRSILESFIVGYSDSAWDDVTDAYEHFGEKHFFDGVLSAHKALIKATCPIPCGNILSGLCNTLPDVIIEGNKNRQIVGVL